MNLKTLSENQTKIWINNLNKVIDLRNAVRRYSNNFHDKMEEQFLSKYGSFFRTWHHVHHLHDLHLDLEGNYHIPFKMFNSRLKKLDTVPPLLLDYKKRLRYKYTQRRDTVLKRLKDKWERCACTPFQIQEHDLEMYQNLYDWHSELKAILEEGGVYDEAFNLDENS